MDCTFLTAAGEQPTASEILPLFSRYKSDGSDNTPGLDQPESLPLVVGVLRRPITLFRNDRGRIRSLVARLHVQCPYCGIPAIHSWNLLDKDFNRIVVKASHCGCPPYRVKAAEGGMR